MIKIENNNKLVLTFNSFNHVQIFEYFLLKLKNLLENDFSGGHMMEFDIKDGGLYTYEFLLCEKFNVKNQVELVENIYKIIININFIKTEEKRSFFKTEYIHTARSEEEIISYLKECKLEIDRMIEYFIPSIELVERIKYNQVDNCISEIFKL
jgi:hypothetical protein